MLQSSKAIRISLISHRFNIVLLPKPQYKTWQQEGDMHTRWHAATKLHKIQARSSEIIVVHSLTRKSSIGDTRPRRTKLKIKRLDGDDTEQPRLPPEIGEISDLMTGLLPAGRRDPIPEISLLKSSSSFYWHTSRCCCCWQWWRLVIQLSLLPPRG